MKGSNEPVLFITYARPFRDKDDEPPVIDVSPSLKKARHWVSDYTKGSLPCFRAVRQADGSYDHPDEPEAWLP